MALPPLLLAAGAAAAGALVAAVQDSQEPAQAPQLTPQDVGEGLTAAEAAHLASSPGGRYLLGLQSASTRASQASNLVTAAEILGGVEPIPKGVHGPARRKLAAARKQAALELPWHTLDVPALQVLRIRLGERYAPGTANLILTVVRGVLGAAWRDGSLDGQEYAKRRVALKAVRGSRVKKGRALSEREQGSLLAEASSLSSPRRERDRLVVVLAIRAGLRRSEIAELPVDAWHGEARVVRVVGKGNKEREVALDDESASILEDWLAMRLAKVESGDGPAPMFLAIDRNGKFRKRMTTQAVRYLLEDLGERAGLEDFSPHDCRRTFISALFEAGVPLPAIMELAGHSQPATTVRYDRGGASAGRAAIQALTAKREAARAAVVQPPAEEPAPVPVLPTELLEDDEWSEDMEDSTSYMGFKKRGP